MNKEREPIDKCIHKNNIGFEKLTFRLMVLNASWRVTKMKERSSRKRKQITQAFLHCKVIQKNPEIRCNENQETVNWN